MIHHDRDQPKQPDIDLSTSQTVRMPMGTLAIWAMLGIGIVGKMNCTVIKGSSGEPNYPEGSYAILNPLEPIDPKTDRFKLVVFHNPCPELADTNFIKRIIAFGGETVEYRCGQLLINGAVTKEPQLMNCETSDFGPIIVPNGEIFVLGDHRDRSSDSREFGTIKTSELTMAHISWQANPEIFEHDLKCPDRSRALELRLEEAGFDAVYSMFHSPRPIVDMDKGEWLSDLNNLIDDYYTLRRHQDYLPAGFSDYLKKNIPAFLAGAKRHNFRNPDCCHKNLIEKINKLRIDLETTDTVTSLENQDR